MPTRTPDHTKTQVEVIPNCDLPHDQPVVAYADARMVSNAGLYNGTRANVCQAHFNEYGCQLGLGRGQMFEETLTRSADQTGGQGAHRARPTTTPANTAESRVDTDA